MFAMQITPLEVGHDSTLGMNKAILHVLCFAHIVDILDALLVLGMFELGCVIVDDIWNIQV